MIYLQNIQDAQALFVPRELATPSGSLTMTLKNTTGLNIILDNVIDLATSNLYHNIALTLPEGTTEGEYEYKLKSGDSVLACGLLVIGEPAETRQYENTIQYEQYNA